jgi:hypothetical protein
LGLDRLVVVAPLVQAAVNVIFIGALLHEGRL